VLTSYALLMGMGLSLLVIECDMKLSPHFHVEESYNAWSLISTPFLRACRDASEITSMTW